MAGSRTYRVRAIVIDKTKLGESDLILTLLADDGRQIRAVAKGARKPGGRLAARCELFSTCDLLLARGRSLDIVSEASLIAAPLGVAPGYGTLMFASAVCEVARACSFEDAPDPFVFPITERALAAAEPLDAAHLDLVCSAYVFKLLSHLGYRPDLSSCVLCGDGDATWFSAAAGGLVCASCAATVAGAEDVGGRVAGWLRSLLALRFDELSGADIDAGTASLLLALSHVWAATHLDARLRALEFMLGC